MHGEVHKNVGISYDNIACHLIEAEKPLEALVFYEKCLKIYRYIYGDNDEKTKEII